MANGNHDRFTRPLAAIFAGLALVTLGPDLQAQPYAFDPSNLIVSRVGGDADYNPGGAGLTSAATAVFLDQFLINTTQTVPVTTNVGGGTISIPLPVIVGTSGNPLAGTDSGSATSHGFFSRTADGLSLVSPGYNAAVGTASVANSNPATINRSISLISPSTLNSTNGFSDGPSGNFRSVASASGNNFYITTNAGLFLKSNTGTVTTTTPIVATGNYRVGKIFGDSLFVSSGSATPGVGVSLVGSVGTLPTGTVTTTLLPGTSVSGTGTPSPYGFALLDNPLNTNDWNGTGFNTLYMADDRTAANGGGIQRWVYDGTTWGLTETFSTGGVGSRGLAFDFDETNNVVTIFSTTAVSAANSLFQVTDTLTASSGAFSAFLSLATAPSNTFFRQVDFAPVPEPATVLGIAALGLGAGGYVRRRWSRAKA